MAVQAQLGGAAPHALVSIATIVPPAGYELGGGYRALVDGHDVLVRAVLNRTAVIEYDNGYRTVMKKANCWINPADVVFSPLVVARLTPLPPSRRQMFRP